MTRKTYIIILLVALVASALLFIIRIDRRPAGAREISQAQPEADFISEQLSKKIADVRARLEAFKTLTTNLKTIFTTVSYETATSLPLITSQGDGLILDFGYPSHGRLDSGFSGFSSTISFASIPQDWASAIKKAFIALGFESLVIVSPAQEWLIKNLLLINDRASRRVSFSSFLYEEILLLFRLAQTDGCDSMKSVFSKISPLFTTLIDSVRIKGVSALTLLDTYYSMVLKTFKRPFSKTFMNAQIVDNPAYVPNGAPLSDEQARGILYALVIRSIVMYASLCDAFNATSEGKVPAARLLDGSLKRTEYNALLPQFSQLKAFIVIELARILQRLENKSYQNVLGKLFDPFLNALGLSFASLLALSDDAHVLPEPPLPANVEPEIDSFSADSLDPDAF